MELGGLTIPGGTGASMLRRGPYGPRGEPERLAPLLATHVSSIHMSLGTPANPADAIDGVVPRVVAQPESAEDVAAMLASASKERASVVVRGGGTKTRHGDARRRRSTSSSARSGSTALVAHEHADLTATAQAGARIDDVNRELARHGQWLPIESAFEEATIGGAIATNDSGPLRHRYGTPRDLLIGIRLALTDGRLIKSGGNVVKNVAGYDLGKLISGSFGSLAAIVSATFKLTPLPAASSTLIATFEQCRRACRGAQRDHEQPAGGVHL